MHERAPFHIKALHGFTGSVGHLVFVVFELFVLFFYQRVVGLDGRLVGLAIFIALVVDALTDPIIGDWSDRLRARFGRRHTMMFGSVLPMGLFFFLQFTPPSGLSQQGLFAWLLVMSVGARVMLTFFDAPAAPVTAEVAVRPADRAEMGIYRQVAGLLAYLGVLYLAFSVYFSATDAFPVGQENPASYAPFGAAAAIALMVFMVVASAGTYRHIRRFERGLPPPPKARFIVTRTEPKYVYLTGYCILLAAYVAPLFFTLAGWLPGYGSAELANVLFGFQLLAGLGAGLLMICSLVMFSETTDEYRFVRNVSRTALIFGLITFGSKVASGVGKVVSGWMLEWVSFPDVKSGIEVGYEVVSDLALYAGVFCAVTGLAGLVVLSTFRLTRARHSEIVAGLRERDRLAQSAAGSG